MSRPHADSDVPRCLPGCELTHPQLAFETSECAQLHGLLRAHRDDGSDAVRYLQRRLSQRQLGERAFTRATGQQLPAIVQVRPPDAAPFQLALLEVFPGEPRNDEPPWCAGGYLLQAGGACTYEWRVVDLAQVRFEEPFVRGAGSLSRGWARLCALCAGLREWPRRWLRPDRTLPASTAQTGTAPAARADATVASPRREVVASGHRCACAAPSASDAPFERIAMPVLHRGRTTPDETACPAAGPARTAHEAKASEALAP
jgi:hypothetical protein